MKPAHKPVYDVNRPDQQRLKIARLEIEAILAKHDLAGVCVLHTPGMSEFFYGIRPSYSVFSIHEPTGELRIRSHLDLDHGGDTALQKHDQVATANMTAALADDLWRAMQMFVHINGIVSKALRAETGPAVFVPDAAEGRPS